MSQREKVLFISLPWTTILEPSLGLSILKSCLDKIEIESKILHLNLLLLRYLKYETYELLSGKYVLNEFLFSGVLDNFNLDTKQQIQLEQKIEEYIELDGFGHFGNCTKDDVFNKLILLRNEIVPKYLNDCAEEILQYDNANLYCFTCMFDQTIASLALASILKSKNKRAKIVFGGYALAGSVALQIMQSFNFVDIVCNGEGEETIVALAQSDFSQDNLNSIPNIIYRDNEYNLKKSTSRKVDLNNSPTPNFDDFVADILLLKEKEKVEITWNSIPLENSRGCWWGEKKHCIFCGIDDDTMKYRVKDYEIALNNIEQTTRKYSIENVRFSDYILPHTYYKTLIPELIIKNNRLRVSCELKANVSYEKMQSLKKAGFVDVQPGIENFSSSILKKIDKGVTGIQNIYTLVLGQIFDIKISYNIIYGFPNDELIDYKFLIDTIPKLYHLDQPYSTVPVSITRFAPLHINPERFGYTLNEIQYDRMYDMLFTSSFINQHKFDLNNYCYYFERPYQFSYELNQLYEVLKLQTQYWVSEKQKRKVSFTYTITDNSINFKDGRYNSQQIQYSFGRSHLEFYKYYYGKLGHLDKIFSDLNGNLDKIEIQNILNNFQRKNVIYVEDNRFVLLAIAENEETLQPTSYQPH